MPTLFFALLFWPWSQVTITTATCVQFEVNPPPGRQFMARVMEYSCDVKLSKPTKQQIFVNYPASTKVVEGKVQAVAPYTEKKTVDGTVLRFPTQLKPTSISLGNQIVVIQ